MATNGQKFYFSPMRDIILFIIKFSLLTLLFCFCMLGLTLFCNDKVTSGEWSEDFATFILCICVILYIIYVILLIYNIIDDIVATKHHVLLIKRDEIVDYIGRLKETKTVIPIKNILYSREHSGVLQRLFHISTFCLYVTEDKKRHFYCEDVKNGQTAYQLIRDYMAYYNDEHGEDNEYCEDEYDEDYDDDEYDEDYDDDEYDEDYDDDEYCEDEYNKDKPNKDDYIEGNDPFVMQRGQLG